MKRRRLKEWEKHVLKENKTSYCGVRVEGFYLQDKEHAAACVERSRLLPCPDCWKEIQRLDAVHDTEIDKLIDEAIAKIPPLPDE